MSVLSVALAAVALFVVLLGLGLVAGVFWLLWRALRVVFWLVARALRLARDEVIDVVHSAGALITAGATIPLAGVNFVIGRWPTAKHYGRAFLDELKGVGRGVWRVALGNPLRFLGLGGLVNGVESRLPDAMDRAPRARRARRATFDGYEVIGTLPSGGSGAQLFVARPRAATQRRFLTAGRGLPSEVVIKSFALESGSTLPQIVRESRALEAASRLGLVCEHQLADDHFYYVMPYVKGEDLERVTRALHARGSNEGLADAELHLVLGYAIDLLDELQRFHTGGLWHKDVKPTNVIVAKGRAHLVDFGLVTPLSSALTLTTHGTEYYRDPEMVRLAMQGVKVHEVDGVRFDVYSAGAVLYSMIENSFPAHGSLSRLGKRSPEALRWVVQRAMSEMGSRYASAAEMRADLAALVAARDAFALLPADLPSFRSEPLPAAPALASAPAAPAWTRLAEPSGWPAAAPVPEVGRRRIRSRGALAAGLALFLLAGLSFTLAGRSQHAARHARVVGVSEHREPGQRWTRLSGRDRGVLALAEEVSAAESSPESDVTLPRVDGSRKDSRSDVAGELVDLARVDLGKEERPATGGRAALPARGRVLVLDDLATGVDGRVLAHLRVRLAERGFRVVGEESDAGEAGEAVELIALARKAVGLGRAEEAETQAGLQAFLEGAAELDAAILVSRAGEAGEHTYRVFLKAAVENRERP